MNGPYGHKAEKGLAIAVLCVFAVANQGMVSIPQRTFEGGNDFLSFYVGGRLAADPHLYDPAEIQKLQQGLGWVSSAWAFVRLPFYAGMLWPLSQLPYAVAIRVWMAIWWIALTAFAWTGRSFLGGVWIVVAAALASYPLSASFISGQDLPILLALVAGALCLLGNGHRFPSGVLLSLCAIKFHLFVGLPIYVIRRREWSLGLGLVAGLSVLIAVSFVLQGWAWPSRYWNQLMQPAIHPSTQAMPNLHGLVFQLSGGPALEVIGALAVAALCWIACEPSRDSLMAFSAMMVSSLLVSHHAYTQDAALLIPGSLILLAKSQNLETRMLALLCLCPVLWVLPQLPGLRVIPVVCMLLLLVFIGRANEKPLAMDDRDISARKLVNQ